MSENELGELSREEFLKFARVGAHIELARIFQHFPDMKPVAAPIVVPKVTKLRLIKTEVPVKRKKHWAQTPSGRQRLRKMMRARWKRIRKLESVATAVVGAAG